MKDLCIKGKRLVLLEEAFSYTIHICSIALDVHTQILVFYANSNKAILKVSMDKF